MIEDNHDTIHNDAIIEVLTYINILALSHIVNRKIRKHLNYDFRWLRFVLKIIYNIRGISIYL